MFVKSQAIRTVFVKHHGKYSSHQKACKRPLRLGVYLIRVMGRRSPIIQKIRASMCVIIVRVTGSPLATAIFNTLALNLRPDRAIIFRMATTLLFTAVPRPLIRMEMSISGVWKVPERLFTRVDYQHSVKFWRTNQILKRRLGPCPENGL